MIIEPPKRPLPLRPVALITPGYRSITIETDAGVDTVSGPRRCYDALSRLEGHAVYTNAGITALRHTTGAKSWTCSAWRGKATSMSLDGTKVKVQSLRGALEGADDPFGELSRAVGFFGQFNIRAAGISSMGWALFRYSLDRPVTIAARPSIGRSALYGGRQEVRNHLDQSGNPRTLSHMVGLDITGAYPHAMTATPYAGGLRRVDGDTVLDPTVPGIVEATVGVDYDMPFRPLPWRVAADMIMFPFGYVTGTWSWCEVVAARDLGCQVTVKRCWAPVGTVDLFNATWAALVAAGRALGGAAARIVKAAANSTWGMFGMRGDEREVIRWEDDAGLHPLRVKLADAPLPHASTCHVAAETAARVRVRMLREGLYGEWAAPVHVDTDGIIVRKSSCQDVPTTAEPGQWRAKVTMRHVDIRAPQVYRYDCGPFCGVDHAPWHYVAAGTPPGQARALFEQAKGGAYVSHNGIDVVMPGVSVQDRPGVRRAVLDARGQIGSMVA